MILSPIELCENADSPCPQLITWSRLATMKLRKVSGCADKDCPAVYVSDSGTAVVQGMPVLAADGLSLGRGETAVELPREVVLAAVKALQEVR